MSAIRKLKRQIARNNVDKWARAHGKTAHNSKSKERCRAVLAEGGWRLWV